MFSSTRAALGRRFLSSTRATSQESKKANSNVLFTGLQSALEMNENIKINTIKANAILPNLVKEFQKGHTYDPFDFSIAKLNLEKKQAKLERANQIGIFDKKKLNPLNYYTNSRELSAFVSSTGRIQPRDVTNLTVKNQKRLAKAIKRARAVGLLSSVHRDIEILRD